MTVSKGSFNLGSNKFDKKKVWKNLIVISTSFLLLFTCYNSMSSLQSTINTQTGTLSLSMLYLSLVLSCLFIPTWVITRFGEKKTINLAMSGYCVYIAAQFYPEPYILMPAAIFLGICAAPLWAAKCTYLTKIAGYYGEIVGLTTEIVLVRFFGIFFLFFQSSYVFGNIISSTVLKVNAVPVSENDTIRLSYCGANYCQNKLNDSFSLEEEVTLTQRYIMSAIYLGFSIVAAIVVFLFVDPIEEETKTDSDETESNMSLFSATLNHLFRNPYQILIVPLTIWSGVEQAFFSADFTAAYIGCGLGVYMVGYVIICYGLADAIGSLLFSYLAKLISRVPIFTFGAVLHLILIVILFIWRPSPNEEYLFFTVAAGWGFADSIWQTQINALYGVLFRDSTEAGFSNYRLWESLGFCLSYFFSVVLCVRIKLISMVVSLVIGMILYYVIELNEKYKLMFKSSIMTAS